MSIKDIANSVKSGETTAYKLTKEALAKAHESQDLNIFISLDDDQALKTAQEIDKQISEGKDPGKLAGVPFAVKDNFLVNYGTTTAASNMLRDYKAVYTATSVRRLLDQGAILIGRVNLDAFAHGTTTENSDFGPTKNPHDPKKVAGGSSGGSAAVVAAGIVPFALGSDTGGSIRLPASFCGVVGYKPSYGLVSRYGVVAMASSTDSIGALANTTEDVAYVIDIMKGQDEFDGTTIDSAEIDVVNQKAEKQKIGVIKEFANYDLPKTARDSFEASLRQLEAQGHELVEVSVPSIEQALACYYILVPAEVSSNLSRYDGVVYGHRAQDANSLDEMVKKSRSEGFGNENKRRIMIGTYVLSSGYYDAYYKKAQRLRTKLVLEFKTALEKAPLLVCPVAPFSAFDIGSKVDDPVQLYLVDIMTVFANLVGAPAISVPAEEVDGMPFGLQLMAAHGDDGLVLATARNMEGNR